MKKKLIIGTLSICLLIAAAATNRGFWDLYIFGPDTRCDFSPGSDYATWSIKDTWDDPIAPNATYEWYVNDYDAQQQGHPNWDFGINTGETGIDFTWAPNFGSGSHTLYEITITCKITSGGETRYEGITVTNCE